MATHVKLYLQSEAKIYTGKRSVFLWPNDEIYLLKLYCLH